jgi:hypothetical protein
MMAEPSPADNEKQQNSIGRAGGASPLHTMCLVRAAVVGGKKGARQKMLLKSIEVAFNVLQ